MLSEGRGDGWSGQEGSRRLSARVHEACEGVHGACWLHGCRAASPLRMEPTGVCERLSFGKQGEIPERQFS